MRIAFDMDGVVADLHTTFVETALRRFPDLDARAVAPADVGASPPAAESDDEIPADPVAALQDATPDAALRSPPLTRRQSSHVWRELCATVDFWETLRECEPGAVKRIAEVADANRWEVLFITSRPTTAGRTVQRQSQRWLERHGFPLPSVYVVHESRGRIADALQIDVVVDDRPDNCLDVVLESKARAILLWRGSPASVPASAKRLNIGVQSTVGSCLDLLVEAERPTDDSTDLMQRLRRLLGLQPKPSSR
jgi:hypothetical protein